MKMKKSVFSLVMLFMVFISFGQTKTQGSSASPQVVNFSDTSKKDFDPALLPIDKQVIPSSESVSYTHLDVYKRQILMMR